MIRAVARAALLALLALVTLWAFVSYLDPAFSGEVAELPGQGVEPVGRGPRRQQREAHGERRVAGRHRDAVPLRLARILEQARPWPRHAPVRGL